MAVSVREDGGVFRKLKFELIQEDKVEIHLIRTSPKRLVGKSVIR